MVNATEYPHKLAIGTTYIGAQVHWGFSDRWALEVRALKGESDSTDGTIKASAVGGRGYWYFRRPSRVRFFLGIEGDSTYSHSESYDYKTHGFAFGGFGGTEFYLLKRLSVGVDAGPYILTSRVRDSQASDSETTFVINSFMNFYFL